MLVGSGSGLLGQWKIGVQVSQQRFGLESLGKNRQMPEPGKGVEEHTCARVLSFV